MNGFAAGLDGGGTKTAVCLTDAQGSTLERKAFGALNVNGAPFDQVRETLSNIVSWIFERQNTYGPCLFIVVGTAGASNPVALDWIETSIRGSGYDGRLLITGDQAVALRGAVGKVGVILIAGTGTICYGQNAAGQVHRCGGFGYLIDDEGSGYAIGRDILSAVVRAHDGRSGPTILTEAVFEQLSIQSIPELIREVYAHATEKSYMAALAPLLLRGLAQKDAASEAIALQAERQLSGLLSTVLTKLRLEAGSFAFSGGVLQHYPVIAQGVLKSIGRSHPYARYITPLGDAASGAAALAWDQINETPPDGGNT